MHTEGAHLDNGSQVTVGSSATLLADANKYRAGLIIQAITNDVRVGTVGVAATTGFKLSAGETITFASPITVRNAVYAIRDGGSDATVLVQEILL